MSAKVYVLLDITDNNYSEIVTALRGRWGIIGVELLEGLPNLMLTIEASDRETLAEFAVGALAQLEIVAENIELLPVRDGTLC